MPWHGDRLVIAAYNPAFMNNLQPPQLQQLRHLGFQLSLDASPASDPLPGWVEAAEPRQIKGTRETLLMIPWLLFLGVRKMMLARRRGNSLIRGTVGLLGSLCNVIMKDTLRSSWMVLVFVLPAAGHRRPGGICRPWRKRKHVSAIASVLEDLVNDALEMSNTNQWSLPLAGLKGRVFGTAALAG